MYLRWWCIATSSRTPSPPTPSLASPPAQYDRRLLTAYLDALIHQGLTQEQQPAGDGQPAAALQLAPGVSLPSPTDHASMAAAIDSFPPDAPLLYSLHSNAQLSLLNSQADTLFATLLVSAMCCARGLGGM